MNTISISKDTPELAEALKNCEVGKPEKLSITITPQAVTDTLLVATVDEVTYDTEAEAEADVAEEAAAPKKKPYKPRTSAPTALDVASE